MITEYWETSFVTGVKKGDNGYTVTEEIVHRRGEDPLKLACRRNNRMAGSEWFSIRTYHAFIETRGGAEKTRHKADLPKDRSTRELAWEM